MKSIDYIYVTGDVSGLEGFIESQAWVKQLLTQAPKDINVQKLTSHGINVYLPVSQRVDPQQEAEKILLEERQIEQEAAKLAAPLRNPQFVTRANPEAVKKHLEAIRELVKKRNRTLERLATLKRLQGSPRAESISGLMNTRVDIVFLESLALPSTVVAWALDEDPKQLPRARAKATQALRQSKLLRLRKGFGQDEVQRLLQGEKQKVLELILDGKTNREISREIHVTPKQARDTAAKTLARLRKAGMIGISVRDEDLST